MVLIYKTEDNEYFTLAELAQKFPKEWAYCLKCETKFWEKLNLIDLLAEASNGFEDVLADLQLCVEPIGSLGNDDLNILLAPLW